MGWPKDHDQRESGTAQRLEIAAISERGRQSDRDIPFLPKAVQDFATIRRLRGEPAVRHSGLHQGGDRGGQEVQDCLGRAAGPIVKNAKEAGYTKAPLAYNAACKAIF